jgi:hypothetical protein
MINIDKIDDGLPISVIVPLSNNRKDFFYNFVLPLVEANNPNEIIINDDLGSAPKKRNNGVKKSTQPYLFFLDDDILLPKNYLETLHNSIKNSDYAYAYTGYKGIVLHPESHPMKGNFEIKSNEFDGNKLKRGNYISTMSLIKKDCFPFFDEKLKRFQDWDIFLNMYINNNYQGKFIPNLQFMAYYIDKGITSTDNSMVESYNIIKNKYNL